MTYQELLVEFTRRRANPIINVTLSGEAVQVGGLEDVQWAIQSILEKLRDEEALVEMAKALEEQRQL